MNTVSSSSPAGPLTCFQVLQGLLRGLPQVLVLQSCQYAGLEGQTLAETRCL